ncbi:hypothetical protein ACWF95_37105 [Streptomyces vinaceus]
MSDLVLRGSGRDGLAEVPDAGEPAPAAWPRARRGGVGRRALASAAMVAALLTSGGIASIGEALAADLPVNISCPQVDTCSVIAEGFSQPLGVAVDDDGNSYVGTANSLLWKVTPGGVKTELATFPNTAVQALTLGNNGNLYVTSLDGVLWKVVPTTGVKTQVTTGLGTARGMAVDGDGNFHVANQEGVLWKVTPGGVKTELANGFSGAYGMAGDGEGNSYVLTNLGVLSKVTPGGVTTQIATGLGISWGVAVDGDGNSYVNSGTTSSVLWRVSPGGVKETVATGIGGSGPTYPRAQGIAFDVSGNAYVTGVVPGNLWFLSGIGAPLNEAPAAPLVSAPVEGAKTGAFPVFKGKAVGENGAVDADEVRVSGEDGRVLETVPVRQSDGYFSWKQNGEWSPGEHTLSFVAIRGARESAPTVRKFFVAAGPATPTVTVPKDNQETGPKPKFTGMAPEATKVLVQNTNNTTIAEVDVRGDGYFSWVQPDEWTPGPHTIQFVAKNAQGLSAAKKITFIVHIPAPVVTLPVEGSGTGVVPKFAGTAPANSTIEFYENDKKLGFTTTKGTGDWAWRLTNSKGVWLDWDPGFHSVDVYTSIGGVKSPKHATVKFTVN